MITTFCAPAKTAHNSTASTPPKRTAATSNLFSDFRSGALPAAVFAGGRSRCLAGGSGPPRPSRLDLLRRHRKVRHLPETYEWVFEKGWLTQFVDGVLASPLIRTKRLPTITPARRTRGIVYLPTTSYIEMNEWTLAGAARRGYHALIEAEKTAGRFEKHKPFLRGGIWRNFMSRYRKPTGCTSACWAPRNGWRRCPRQSAVPPCRNTCTGAQANDAYWHGLFGGLYLPHLRRAVWNNLLALEAALSAVSPAPTFERLDLDHDGCLELALRNSNLQAFVRDDHHAALVEFSSLALAHNFGDTLRAYAEAYHAKIDMAQAAQAAQEAGDGIVSAHDRVAFLHAIAPEDAHPTRVRGESLWNARAAPATRWRPSTATVPATGRALGRPRRRLADIQDLHPRGRRAERCLSRRRHSNSGPDRDRTQSCPAQLRRLRRPLRARRRQHSGGFGHALELDGMQRITWRTANWAAPCMIFSSRPSDCETCMRPGLELQPTVRFR